MMRLVRHAVLYGILFVSGVGVGLSIPVSGAIRSAKIASVADDVNIAKIQPSDLNPMVEPMVPVQNDIWFEITGTSPTRAIAMKVYDGGAWRTVASITY